MPKLPRGVYVRSRWDWVAKLGAGGTVFLGAVGGAFGKVALYNDSNPQVDLAVYGLFLFAGVGNGITLISQFKGTIGAFNVAGAPVVSGAAAPPGSLYSLNDASAPGTNIADFSGPNGYAQIVSDSPLFIMPPGWSLIAQNQQAGFQCDFGFLWAPN